MSGEELKLVGRTSTVANIIEARSNLKFERRSFEDFLATPDETCRTVLCCKPEMSPKLKLRLESAQAPVFVVCSASANSLVADSFRYSALCKKFFLEVYALSATHPFVKLLVCGQFESAARKNELLVCFSKFDDLLKNNFDYGYPNLGGIEDRSKFINVWYELVEGVLGPKLTALIFKCLSKQAYGYNRL